MRYNRRMIETHLPLGPELWVTMPALWSSC
jgi:hypothetical protein